jgi:hypothetical protein
LLEGNGQAGDDEEKNYKLENFCRGGPDVNGKIFPLEDFLLE